jgi:hypothetical protein
MKQGPEGPSEKLVQFVSYRRPELSAIATIAAAFLTQLDGTPRLENSFQG